MTIRYKTLELRCVVCGKPIGKNGVVYKNSVGQVEALCENNHDILLQWLEHTPMQTVSTSDSGE